MSREPESFAETGDVGVHDNSIINTKGISQDHIRGLATDPGEFDQFSHGPRNFPVMLLNQQGACGSNVFRLVPKKTNFPQIILQRRNVGARVILCRRVLPKKLRCNLIYQFVGALSGQNRGDKQFKRRPVSQLTMSVWIRCRE